MLLLTSFFENIIPTVLVFLLVLNLLTVSIADRKYYFQERKRVIFIFIGFYMLHVIGVSYSEDMQSALFDLEVKLSMFFVPLLFLTSSYVNKFTVVPLIKTFIFGVCVAMGIQLLLATVNYNDTGDFRVYYYTLFSFFHHPSYFSMYTNFAIGSILVLIFHSKNRPRPLLFALLMFLAIGVYLLSSRAGILTFLVLIVLAFARLLFPVLKWKKMLLALIVTCVFIGLAVFSINQYTSFSRKVDASNANSSSGIRIEMWRSSIPIIKENLLFGVGTGDVNRELQVQFAKDGLKRAVRDNLNAHNQIIQTQVALGLLGLVSLGLCFFYPFYLAVKRKNLFYPMFAIIMGVNFLTESMFNAQAGVIFFALINACLFPTYGD